MKIQEIKVRVERMDEVIFYHISFISEEGESYALSTADKELVKKEVEILLSYT